MTLRTTGADQTRALGRRLGARLRAGDVVALSGDLGTGKTVLAQGIAEGAGARGYTASPTFTLVREYTGPVPVYHVDLFRLDDPRELADIGFGEIVEQPGIVVIEWAEKAGNWLPDAYLQVTLEFGAGEDDRTITVTGRGPRYQRLAAEIAGPGHEDPGR